MDPTRPDSPTSREIFADAKAVLERQLWLDDLRSRWPTPIANEVEQLFRMLDEGIDAGGILMQVRDTAEVLLKTLTLVAAADLIAHGNTDGATTARHALFGGRLSLGDWTAAFASFSRMGTTNLLVPELIPLGKPDQMFLKAINTYVGYRNSDVAHGAYRPDSVELAKCVHLQLLGSYNAFAKRYEGGIDSAFAEVASKHIWRDCSLHADMPDGPAFSGATAVHAPRPHPEAHRTTMDRRLYLTRGNRSLDLWPFITGRICPECGHRDAFLFDSPKGWAPKEDPRFDFLDYAHGHRLKVDARKTETRLAELADIPLSDLSFEKRKLSGGGEFASRDVVRLLEDIMFDQRFISPEWLRTPLRAHMEQNGKGIFWLQAPAHIGKTVFVRGLFGEGLREADIKKQRALLGENVTLAVAPVFLKREYRFDMVRFASELKHRIGSSLRTDTALWLQLPRDGTPQEMQAGFVQFLQEAMTAARINGSERLIVAIDGMDELREPEGPRSVIDYIPPADTLPEGITLLLTSRPRADCPPWLRNQLGHDFAPGHQPHVVGRADEQYLVLLRDYIGRHAGVTPDEADFEDVYRAILDRSDSLFLIVSFLCDLIRDGATSGFDSSVPALS